MSIPKEPRQLMINLMYLVLTALLALNVSAEVMNAFFSIDKGMKSSMNVVESTNGAVMNSINKVAEAYNKPENIKYRDNAREAIRIGKEFEDYVESVRNTLFNDLAKGPSKKDPSIPKDIRNKDVTTNYFINQGHGAEIEAKLRETRERLLALADNDEGVSAQLPLNIEEVPAGSDAKNWPELKFKQMPVAAVFPILAKIQSDAKSSTAAILNYCAKKVNGEEIILDTYLPVLSAKKSYLIAGEKYEADVFLGAYSSTADNISISVNGANLPVKEGKATYSAEAGQIGTKTLKVSINIKNPLTGEVKNYSKDFEYEVGQRSVAVALDKMNVFYIGVDNPVTISAAGVSSNEVRVNTSGIDIRGAGGSKYVVTAKTPTNDAKLTVSAQGASSTFSYRVKRIPDPVALLGAKHKGGSMANGEFKAQGGIAAVLQNFDFDVKCDLVGFNVTYLAKRQDPVERQNPGARWTSDVSGLIQKARPGDAYFFDDIKARCPGDPAPRDLGSLAFKIR